MEKEVLKQGRQGGKERKFKQQLDNMCNTLTFGRNQSLYLLKQHKQYRQISLFSISYNCGFIYERSLWIPAIGALVTIGEYIAKCEKDSWNDIICPFRLLYCGYNAGGNHGS